MVDENAKHYLVMVENMPATKVQCKCGVVIEGPNCVDQMSAHIKISNAAEQS